jgi:NAD+ synthetase
MISLINTRSHWTDVIEQNHFPDGTLHINMPPNYFDYDTVLWEYENDAELFTLICVKGHFKDCPLRLDMPYIPHAIAAARHGRVANTCNRSENYVGYSTKFGDSAGDFSILHNYTVTEVKEIGLELGLPEKFIEKVPEDGLTGLSDEENLGFSYKTLDNFLLYRITPPYEVYKNIEQRHKRNLHKTEEMPICPFF